MFASIGKFLKDRKGAFALQFALMAIPLTVCTGLAIDGGRAFLARYELAAALDAAALAIASTVDEDSDINAIAHKFVNANFHGEHNGPIALTVEDVGDEEETVILQGQVTIDTYFMPIVGQPTVTVSAESEVKRGGNNVEVALALDITASMTMGVDRMTPLRAAAKDLINTVVSENQTPFYSRVAIVPWGSAVNAGSLAPTLRGAATQGAAITAAGWRVAGGVNRTISDAHWRNGSTHRVVNGAAWWKPTSSKAVTAVTRANPAVVTSASHGYATDDYVYISGVGGMTQVNNRIFRITVVDGNTYRLRDPSTLVNINSSTWTALTSAGNSKECYNAACQIQVTTTAAHGFATGDRIHISGITGMTEINNGQSGTTPPITWGITAGSTTSTFFINDITGPTVTSTWSTSGTASAKQAVECKVANCEVRVTTTAAHGFTNGDFVVIWGVNGFTQANNAVSTSWTVGSASGSTFQLAGTFGPTIGGSDYSSAGTVAECQNATCEVAVTTTAPSLNAGDDVTFTGLGGMTTLNGKAWPIRSKTVNTVVLNGAHGPSHTTNWTSGGSAWCAELGCEYYHYTKPGAAPNSVVRQITTCVSERTGADRYTDAAPGGSPLAPYYAAGGYNVCGTGNRITPLTSHKAALRDHIDALVVSGSTAGQVGIGWGWYMLSEHWGDLWSGYSTTADDGYSNPGVTYHAPGLYEEAHTKKVLVLMTDGEFNTAHCNGVASSSWAVSGSGAELNNCAPNNDTPFNQARAICNAMDDEIIIFTVGFQIDPNGEAAEFLEECASPQGGFFLSTTGQDLQDDFADIAESISMLRISR